jgi:hypothetical protein
MASQNAGLVSQPSCKSGIGLLSVAQFSMRQVRFPDLGACFVTRANTDLSILNTGNSLKLSMGEPKAKIQKTR